MIGNKKIASLRLGALAAAAAIGLAALSGPASAGLSGSWSLSSNCTQISPSSPTTCQSEGTSEGGGNVDSFTPTSGSGDVTASAYHSSVNTALGGATLLGYYAGYGLGAQNLAPPQHALNNYNGFGFIVLELPGSANAATVTLSSFGTNENMNATIIYGTPTGSLAGITGPNGFANDSLATLLANGFSETTTNFAYTESNGTCVDGAECGETNGTQNVSITDPGGTFTYIIIAADLTPGWGEYDYFKVNDLTVTSNTSPIRPVPEPGSLLLLASGLAIVGFLLRRRQRRKSS